jgi:hypothetical protein
MDSLRQGWRWFRSLSVLAQATAWIVFAIVFAVVGMSIEKDPVKQSNERLAAYEKAHGIESATQGSKAAGEKGAPEEQNSAPVQVGQEGQDTQLAAGATPNEVAAAAIKNFKANTGGVRNLFEQTIGNRGRAGLRQNKLLKAKCTGGNCTITYRPDGPGIGRVIETQGPLWDTFITDPRWKSTTITAVPALHGNGKPRKGPNIVISCTRAGVAKVGKWGIQATPKIRRFCSVTPPA